MLDGGFKIRLITRVSNLNNIEYFCKGLMFFWNIAKEDLKLMSDQFTDLKLLLSVV